MGRKKKWDEIVQSQFFSFDIHTFLYRLRLLLLRILRPSRQKMDDDHYYREREREREKERERERERKRGKRPYLDFQDRRRMQKGGVAANWQAGLPGH
jgi:hypothetical protein